MKKSSLLMTLVLGAVITLGLAWTTGTEKAQGLSSLQADHIAIGVVDFEENVKWYKEVLGFEEEVRWQVDGLPHLYFAYLTKGDNRIEIIGNPTAKKNNVEPADFAEHLSQQGFVHLCFQVDDLDLTFQELNAKGVPTFVPHASYGLGDQYQRSVGFIKDPSGNVIELANHLQRENQ